MTQVTTYRMFIMLLFRNTKTWFESMVGSKATKQLEHIFLYADRQKLGTNKTVQIKIKCHRKMSIKILVAYTLLLGF